MPGSELKADLWISEYVTPFDVYLHGVETMLASKRTAYQDMHIVKGGPFGKALVLDGKWQSCTGDEFLYHETLIHPAFVMHGGPQNVLILGGGEGAAVREALKWTTVEKVVMVDIDGEVVEACRVHLPEMHQGAFDDARTELVIGDALDFLDHTEPTWDVIVSDLSDPIEEGPSFKLFTREYFEKCKQALRPGGKFVVQAGPSSPIEMTLHVRIVSTLRAVFADVASFYTHTPSYASPWGFAVGSETAIDRQPDPTTIDALLAAQTTGKFRMFDGITLAGLHCPAKYLRDAIAAETQVYTLAEPPKFFGHGVAAKP